MRKNTHPLRQKALEEYYRDPTICKQCKKPIPIPDHRQVWAVRSQSFCGKSCVAAYRAKDPDDSWAPVSPKLIERPCKHCGDMILVERRKDGRVSQRKVCDDCAPTAPTEKPCNYCNILIPNTRTEGGSWSRKKVCDTCRSIDSMTFGSLKRRRHSLRAVQSIIRNHARLIYGKANKVLECYICSYDATVHIAHIKAVQEFSDDDLIVDINNINNLMALCPNHHWEHDHGGIRGD
jgi:hypothetical protein